MVSITKGAIMSKGIIEGSGSYPWPLLDVHTPTMQQIMQELDDPGNQYRLGGKWPLDLDPEEADGRRVDCSGFVRWLLYQSSPENNRVIIPDGSVVQHDWIKDKGFKKSTIAAGRRQDGFLRIAFLPPGGGIGHVVLILDGRTLESAGGTGPDSRVWDGLGWQRRAFVYVLASPDL